MPTLLEWNPRIVDETPPSFGKVAGSRIVLYPVGISWTMSDLIDPDYHAYLVDEATDGIPPRHSLSTAGARALMEAPDGVSPQVRATKDLHIPTEGGDIGIRVYLPDGEPPFPVLLYYHGGGWVRGDLRVVDGKCRALCVKSGSMVVSVDYRLAPEHPFPAAVHDTIASIRWVDEYVETIHGDPERIAVSGMSAGGEPGGSCVTLGAGS